MEQIALFIGYITIIAFGVAVALFLLVLVWEQFEKLCRIIFVWYYIGDFDLWNTFRQFCKVYYPVKDDKDCTICPHCGGTGRIDDDEDTKKRLHSLQNIVSGRRNKIRDYFAKNKTA